MKAVYSTEGHESRVSPAALLPSTQISVLVALLPNAFIYECDQLGPAPYFISFTLRFAGFCGSYLVFFFSALLIGKPVMPLSPHPNTDCWSHLVVFLDRTDRAGLVH